MNFSEIGISSPIVSVLIARGYDDVERAKKFLYPKLEHLHDPFGLPDMKLAVDRTLLAITQKEHILIWGHNDVDGITATALLVKVIRDLGGVVNWYIPQDKTVSFFRDTGVRLDKVGLIITVDCGSSIQASIEGIDIIITDHHVPAFCGAKGKPDAFAFINPKYGYEFPWLAGVGVAYKLAQALTMQKLNLTPYQWFSATKKLLPLVLLGTVADRVELVDENRTFVKLGMSKQGGVFPWCIPARQNGIPTQKGGNEKETRWLSGLPLKFDVRESIRLLGSARVNPDVGVEFILANFSDDDVRSTLLSKLEDLKLDQDNKIEEAYRLCLQIKSMLGGFIFVCDDALDPNIIGVCASKLMAHESLSSIVIGKSRNGLLVGECRSPEGVDLIEVFKKFDTLFIDCGGHKMAVGFTMHPSKLDEFKLRLSSCNYVLPEKVLNIDAEIEPNEITPDLFRDIELLEPFGPGNPNPLFLTRGIGCGMSLWDLLPMDTQAKACGYQCDKFDVIWTVDQSSPIIKEWSKV